MEESWKYYNHALIPTTEPHEKCVIPKNKRAFWKIGKGVCLLARWSTNWDCGYETNWWYVIKDSPYSIESLKAKRRYEINKGKKNFIVIRINPIEFKEEMYEVSVAAYKSWPEKYRPIINKDKFIRDLDLWKNGIVYGGFDNENGRLCGFSYLKEFPGHLEFSVLRVRPESEKRGINTAIIATMLEDYNDKLGKNFYINDGTKSIRHETAFQDYLEKYFGFRKAYCKLNILYRFPIGVIVRILYPFRNRISSDNRWGSMISGVLKMEEISRS